VDQDGAIILKNDCPTYGGSYYSSVEEALEQVGYELTHPIDKQK